MNRASSHALVAASLSLVACVSVTEVRGPDGENAHLIKCPRTESCYEKATDLCPEGWVLRSNNSKLNVLVVNGSGSASSSTEVLVSCKNDVPSTKPQAVPGDDREDARTCDAAYAFVDGFAEYWGRASKGKRLDEKPSKRDFTATCRAVPENVQRCMHEKYREAHGQACEAVLARLEPPTRAKIDSLFLEAPAVRLDATSAK